MMAERQTGIDRSVWCIYSACNQSCRWCLTFFHTSAVSLGQIRNTAKHTQVRFGNIQHKNRNAVSLFQSCYSKMANYNKNQTFMRSMSCTPSPGATRRNLQHFIALLKDSSGNSTVNNPRKFAFSITGMAWFYLWCDSRREQLFLVFLRTAQHALRTDGGFHHFDLSAIISPIIYRLKILCVTHFIWD